MPMDRPESVIQRTFAAGEIAPVLHARADLEKYISGLKTCKNFLVLRHGGAANRPGFRFVGPAKTNNSNVRLQRYVSETASQGILIEAGSGYFRFYKNGAPITLAGAATAWSNATAYVVGDLASSGGVNYYCILAHTNQAPPNATYWYPLTGLIYEIPSPYTTAGLFGSWEQSGNVIVITHRLHDPRELVYFSDTNWVLRLATTQPATPAPTTLALVVGAAGTVKVGYVVTAAAAETYEESKISNAVTSAVSALPTEAAPNALTWDVPAVAPAEWYVYKDLGGNGEYGYIGTARGTPAFNDVGIAPDYTVTPPLDRTPFVSANTRPHVAAHYQQRRFYAQSNASPEGVEGSRIGFPNNFGRSSPLQDDDALTFRVVGRQYHPVRHMLGLGRLILFTDGGAWTIGKEDDPLTPSSLFAKQHTYKGAAPDVVPVVVGETVIYLQARGRIVRDLRFDLDVQGLAGRDLTLFATHLFEKPKQITGLDYADVPNSIVWAIRNDGTLLGLTYLHEEEIFGWHRHTTQGAFEQLCVVPEAGEDVLYVVTSRTIGGGTVRYIERLASREIVNFDADSFFVDSGLSYSGAPATTFSGLGHLEGQRVAIVADGSVVSDGSTDAFKVAGGAVTIPTAASNVHVGLAIQFADFETLNLDVQGSAIRDKKKRVGSITLLVDASSRTFAAGPDSDSLVKYEIGGAEPAGDTITGEVEVQLSTTWNEHGRVFVRQSDPLPLTILGLLPNALTEP